MSVTLDTPLGPKDFFYLLTNAGALTMVIYRPPPERAHEPWLVRRWLAHAKRWMAPQKLHPPITSDVRRPTLEDPEVYAAVAALARPLPKGDSQTE